MYAVYNVGVAPKLNVFQPQIEGNLSFIPSTCVKLNLMSLQLGLAFAALPPGLDESSLISLYDPDFAEV